MQVGRLSINALAVAIVVTIPPIYFMTIAMNVASVSRFLHSLAALGPAVFGERLSQTEWQILVVLGGAKAPTPPDGASGHSAASAGLAQGSVTALSYKTLKCHCGVSDDALSRGLRRLVVTGLVLRTSCESDQRSVRYGLSPKAEQAFSRMGSLVVAELAGLVLSLSMALAQRDATEITQKDAAG
jgi:DNA-binding MarR family transcriptional regulator